MRKDYGVKCNFLLIFTTTLKYVLFMVYKQI